MLKKQIGFTLIELLIVVAIIAILAAIAIPNFLAAQMRSKVARVKGEHRTIATALESYYVDNTEYPNMANWYYLREFNTDTLFGPVGPAGGRQITTPISYITKVPQPDIFSYNQTGSYVYPYRYCKFYPNNSNNYNQFGFKAHGYWLLGSAGPDRGFMSFWQIGYPDGTSSVDAPKTLYDPSNGTVSNGDIIRSQGGTTQNL